ncbi:MAG: hypothetical protein WC586_06520 [Methanoregula sp.]
MISTKKSKVPLPDYPVICHVNNSGVREKVKELSSLLERWDLYENNLDDPILKKNLKTAVAGSSFGGPSPTLTRGQLFAVWRSGGLIHSAYYDEDGNEIQEKLYQVGMGCGLSGAYVFWGIVPSRKTIVISNKTPSPGACSIVYNMRIYNKAAKNTKEH